MDSRTRRMLDQVDAARRETQEILRKLNDMAGALAGSGSTDAGATIPTHHGPAGSGVATGSRIPRPPRLVRSIPSADADMLRLGESLNTLSHQISSLSNVLKSAHDQTMNTVRNIRR